MKKLFSNSVFHKTLTHEYRGLWKLWIFIHITIPALLGISFFFTGQVRINTNLLDMLPRPEQSRAAAKADIILGEKNGREAIVLAAATDFEDAKKGAVLLHDQIKDSPLVENLSLYYDHTVIEQLADYFHSNRYVIASGETRNLLETGRAIEIAEDALARAFGAFNFSSLDKIEEDPFLLTERRMQEFLSSSLLTGGNLSLKSDVLAAAIEGTWYVMLRITLTPQGVSLAGEKNAVSGIYAAAASAREDIGGLEFYFSGIPFHSYESSSGAQREISIISTVVLIIILALFLFIFRSPLPALIAVLDALTSIAIGAVAALLVFREIHIITFVFGTTLIGICIDYSLHFFVHWKGSPALKDGYAIRSYISKSIIMCFISSEICFFFFLFAPFPILKQFAVFCMAGLLSSFLTSYCLYPLIKVPEDEKRKINFFQGRILKSLSVRLKPSHRLVIIAGLTALALAVIIFNPKSIKIKNDISSFYTMSPFLLESEKRAAKVLDQGSAPWYYIVSGSSPEETLENEQSLFLRLEEEISKGNLGSFFGTSTFVPSIKRQKETYEAMKALLPLAVEQYEYLGFPPEYAGLFYDEFAAAENYCLPEQAPPIAGLSNLWIGETGGNYYSCVMLFHPGSETAFRAIAEEFGFVHFIHKSKDISRDLDILTETMVFFFLAAYFAVSVLVCFVYPWRDSLKINAIPVFLFLSTLAVMTAIGKPPGFFSAAGFVLVFGLGLDFVFYMTKKGNNSVTVLAVTLSFITSLLSFGALVLSGFMPVHIFGLTVSVGLGAAFISAILLTDKTDSENHRISGMS